MVSAKEHSGGNYRQGGQPVMTAGGTLIISRAKNILPFWKYYLKTAGFQHIVITSEEKDSLNWVINEQKPRLVFIESFFYEAATPYMTGRLPRDFPKLRIAAFSAETSRQGILDQAQLQYLSFGLIIFSLP